MSDRPTMPDANRSDCTTAPGTIPISLNPLAQLLSQLRSLLETIDTQQYNCKPKSTQCGAIGGHLRHSLDHIAAWLCGINQETINYDDRQRGTDVETNPNTAVAMIDHYLAQFATINPQQLLGEVAVFTSMTSDGALVRLPSTHARELAFVFSHTVHHNAIIGTIARAQGIDLPNHFGMAPSTIAYRDGGCVR